jgi:hypothetical protein
MFYAVNISTQDFFALNMTFFKGRDLVLVILFIYSTSENAGTY